ncbi:10928_t:CDS:2, partial [Gigaspora rosea]
HKLNKEMSNEELTQHAPPLLELLTDRVKRDKGRRRFKKDMERQSRRQLSALFRIVLMKKKVDAITKALVETAPNVIAGSLRISRLRRELRKLNAPEKVISATLDRETTCASNKIQIEHREQRKNEGINYPDEFSFESVKE